MENTLYKITEFFGGDLTLALDTNAAWVTNHLAHHVLRLTGGRVTVLLPLPADRPLGDVIRPHIGSHAGRSLAETETENIFNWRHEKYDI